MGVVRDSCTLGLAADPAVAHLAFVRTMGIFAAFDAEGFGSFAQSRLPQYIPFGLERHDGV